MLIKEGDEVILYLDEVIVENEKKKARFHHLLKFWKAINGKKGVVVEVVSDEEIWVKRGNTGVTRMFNRATLKKRE